MIRHISGRASGGGHIHPHTSPGHATSSKSGMASRAIGIRITRTRPGTGTTWGKFDLRLGQKHPAEHIPANRSTERQAQQRKQGHPDHRQNRVATGWLTLSLTAASACRWRATLGRGWIGGRSRATRRSRDRRWGTGIILRAHQLLDAHFLRVSSWKQSERKRREAREKPPRQQSLAPRRHRRCRRSRRRRRR